MAVSLRLRVRGQTIHHFHRQDCELAIIPLAALAVGCPIAILPGAFPATQEMNTDAESVVPEAYNHDT